MVNRIKVNWQDEISVVGHAIYWAWYTDRGFIVYENHGVFAIAYAEQRAEVERTGHTVKYHAKARRPEDKY